MLDRYTGSRGWRGARRLHHVLFTPPRCLSSSLLPSVFLSFARSKQPLYPLIGRPYTPLSSPTRGKRSLSRETPRAVARHTSSKPVPSYPPRLITWKRSNFLPLRIRTIFPPFSYLLSKLTQFNNKTCYVGFLKVLIKRIYGATFALKF